MVFHVLNRGVERLPLFGKEGDYEAFERMKDDAPYPGSPRTMNACRIPDSSELKKPSLPSGERKGWMWASFFHEDRGFKR